jgi:hypothetical protein
MAQLVFLDGAALRQAARSTMVSEQVGQMEALNLKQQREGLTPEERQALAQLLRRYEHVMLVRAKAAASLKERGYDISISRIPRKRWIRPKECFARSV